MAYLEGNRQKAVDIYSRLLPLINYENRQCGFRAAKTIMMEGGVIKSDYCRHPIAPLSDEIRKGLLELALGLNPLALSWGK